MGSCGGNKLDDLVKDAKEVLGDDVRVITNESGDKIFLGKDYKFRFDINNPSPHMSPHMHMEKWSGSKWKDLFGQIYPKDVLPK